MKKKMMKALRDLNAYIDDDRQKLCDRIHDLELSHKRMERLLRRCSVVLHLLPNTLIIDEVLDLKVRISQELSYPYCCVNYKMKGGKKCG